MILPWRPFPIVTLTIRQFMVGRAVRIVAALAAIPLLFALVYRINSDWSTVYAFLVEQVFLNVFSPTLLPIMVLILATGALGNEVEDRTLLYLTLKPRMRLRIVLEKFVGILAVAVPTILVGLALAFALASTAPGPRRLINRGLEQPDLTPVFVAAIVAAFFGIVAFAAVFLAVSLFVPRALLVGIVYAFAWESLLGRFIGGIRLISIRHYVQSIFVSMLDDPDFTVANAFTAQAAMITIVVAVILSLALATWRLGRMQLD